MERTGLPGAAVAVTRGQEVVLTAGYGHDSDGAPLRADTPAVAAAVSTTAAKAASASAFFMCLPELLATSVGVSDPRSAQWAESR